MPSSSGLPTIVPPSPWQFAAGGEDLAYVRDREHGESEFALHVLHGGQVGVLRLLHAVDGQDESDDVDVGLLLELGNDFAHRRARGHHIVDEEHVHAVLEWFADHRAAVAVVLLLLAVERVADGHTVVEFERDRRGDGERDAFVRGAEDRVDADRHLFVVDLGLDLLRVERAECRDLPAVVERARVDEVR